MCMHCVLVNTLFLTAADLCTIWYHAYALPAPIYLFNPLDKLETHCHSVPPSLTGRTLVKGDGYRQMPGLPRSERFTLLACSGQLIVLELVLELDCWSSSIFGFGEPALTAEAPGDR